jgi:hypothetical protein
LVFDTGYFGSFFLLRAGFLTGGLGGGAPSSGNSLQLNFLPPPIGMSSMLAGGLTSLVADELIGAEASKLDSASVSFAASLGSSSIKNS